MSFQAARDFSSLLLGELRPEDLVSQGVANDEARRRTVLRNWILERLANLISFAVFSGVIMPHIVLILYMAATIATQCFDLISGMSITDAFREFLVSLFMNHWDDACNVPLGVLSRLFWIVLLVRLSIFYIWCLGALVTARCSCECSFLASALFYLIKSPAVALAVAFELLWPILTFVCICISSATGECSEELQLGCSLLLAPYFGQVLYIIFQCMKPVLYRTGIIRTLATSRGGSSTSAFGRRTSLKMRVATRRAAPSAWWTSLPMTQTSSSHHAVGKGTFFTALAWRRGSAPPKLVPFAAQPLAVGRGGGGGAGGAGDSIAECC